MKSLIKYLKEDFDDWLSNPLYRGGLWEDAIITVLATIGLIIVIGLAIHGNAQ